MKRVVGQWIISKAAKATLEMSTPLIRHVIKTSAPDTRQGGEIHPTSQERMEQIDGRLRDHEVTIPEEWVDPTPDSDTGEILGGVENWRKADDPIADRLQEKLQDILDPDGWSPQEAWESST